MAALDEMQTVQDMPTRPKDSKAFKAAMNTLCPSKVMFSINSLKKERDSKVKDAANRADNACYTLKPLTLFQWQVAEMNKRPRMTGSEKNQRCYGRGSASSLEGLHRIVKTMLVKKENKRNPAVAKAAMTAKTYCGPPDQAKLL